MPTYSLTSPASGRSYDVDFEATPAESDMEDAVSFLDEQATKAETQKPGFRVGDALSGAVDAVSGLTKTLPAAYYRLNEGFQRPDKYSPSARAAFDEEAKYAKELEDESTARLMRGEASSTGDAFRSVGPSLGFSGASMAAAIPAGFVGGKGGASVGAAAGGGIGAAFGGVGAAPGAAIGAAVGGTVGSVGAAMAAAGTAAYRMAGAQFLDDTFQAWLTNNPQADEAAREAAYQELLPLAQDSALWEAGPEAIGTVVGMGAGKVILGLGKQTITKLATSALGKAGIKVGALATGVGTELATETATQVGQGLPQAKAAAFANGQDMSQAKNVYDVPGGTMQALRDVTPQTLALSGLMLGMGGAVKGAANLRRKPAELPTVSDPSTPPPDTGLGSSELAQIAARGGRVDTPLDTVPSAPVPDAGTSAAAPTGLGPTGTVIPASGQTASVPPATGTSQVPAQTAGLGSSPASVSAAAPGATLPSANAPTPAGSTQLPSAEQVTPTAPTAAESAIPQSGAALPGSLPASSQPNQSAAQSSPGSSAAAALNSAPTSPPTTASQAAAVPQARPATESQRARLRVAERVLTTQGVDQETAAVLAVRLAESLPEGLPMEAMRERVLSEFAAAGGTLPGSVPRRYVEDAAAYVGAGYSEQDAAMLAAQSKAANDADVQAAHAKNSQLREVLNRPRVKMSKPPVKGTGKTDLARVRAGDVWQAVKGLFRTYRSSDKPTNAPGDQRATVSAVAKMLTQSPVVRDASGVPVRMDFPDSKGNTGDGLMNRVWHLLGKGESQRTYDARKARTALSTPTTIQDYHAKVRMPSGAIGYVRTYADGTTHLVLTVDMPAGERVVIDQETVAQGLETQYPLDNKSPINTRGIDGAVILETRTALSSAGPAAGSGIVPGAPGPGSNLSAQTAATPNTQLNSNNAGTTGPVKQSRPTGRSSRLTPAQAKREAQTVLRSLTRTSPELAAQVKLVANRDALTEDEFHPDDWAEMAGSEGFFDPQTGSIVIFTDQVEVRKGETPQRAILRVIVHETIGHSGLEALRQTSNPAFAKRWNALIDQIENDPTLSAEIASIAEQPGYEHLAEDSDGLVEEWFARHIEGMDETALNAVPATSTLGKLLQWLKDALAYVASGFSSKAWTAREIREIAALSRQALRDGGPQGVSDGRVKQSRKFNPLQGSDLPNWLRRPLGMPANAPFRVQALGLRALLKGSALPTELIPFARRSERDISALRQSAAQIGQDLNTAIDAYSKRSGMTLEAAHVLVAKAMETPALLAAIPDPVLKERIRRARNLLDDLSATTAKYTGGDLGAAILKNRGHWMRRAYACFDEASNWTFDNLDAAAKKGQKINGVDAAKILKDARDYITRNVTAQRVAAKEPAPKPGEIEAIMRQMTDKNVWEKSLLGNASGAGISKDVTSLMHRAAYHPDVMAWLKRNSITNWDYQSIAALAATGGSWEGRNAAVTLAAARANLALLHPKATPGEINDMLRQQDIAAPIRALMGEEVNPVKRFLNSASFQAQYIARHEQQTAMRDVGLQIGLFSTNQTGVFTEELGDGRERNGFKLPVQKVVNGKTVLVEEAIYTTPEVMNALARTKITGVSDAGYLLVDAMKWIGSEAKLNKVALNPDSWMVNLLGNFMGLVQSGDLISFTPWRNVQRAIELHRSGQAKAGDALDAVREAETDQRRQMLSRLTAAGVANSGLEISDIEAGLDNRVLQFIEQSDAWDIAAGGVRGAILGNGLGRPFGIIGQGIGAAIGAGAGAKIGGKKIQGVQRKIAEWTTGNPDRFAKLAAFYSNYEAHLAAGMAEQDAFNLATEKTMNTLPDYSKLPALMRELSRLGLMGSFIGFQYEVYRNTYWNAKYAKQELTSGNAALIERGMKRFVGLSGMLALAGAGLAGIIRGLFGAGVDDEKDKAYRRALGAEHERFGTLAYTKLDAEGASFFNTSYLLPQVTLFEVLKAGLEGRDLGESLKNIAKQLTDQFVSGSVHLDPLIAAWTNQRPIGGKVSFEEGATGITERVAYFLYVTAEPGALNKEDRLVRAMQGRARYGRQFSVGEELKRFLGIRQNTYTHEERIESRLFRFRDAYNDARSLARTSYRQGDPNAAGALARANERIAALQAEYDQFQVDLLAIGVPQNKFEQIRKAVGTSRQFAPLIMGEDGPESEQVKTRKAYSTDNAPSTSEPSRMTLPPRR